MCIDFKDESVSTSANGQKSEVLDKLFRLFERKVIKDQETYILTELLEDLKEISEDHDLLNPPISKTFNLKQKLIGKFGESIDFHVVDRRLIVHASGVNQYCIQQLHLRLWTSRRQLDQSFSRLIRIKFNGGNP